MRPAIRLSLPRIGWSLGLTAVLTILIVACGEPSSPTPTQTATATAAVPTETPQPIATLAPTAVAVPTETPQPIATLAPTAVAVPTETPRPIATLAPTTAEPDGTPQPTRTPTQGPEVLQPSPTPTISPTAEPEEQRDIGQVDGVTFVVGEGSEATFTVEEKLSRLPLPSDAVVRTTALSGEVHLDGRPSVIEIDLHQLESDQPRRDRYIRDRMFPNDPIATFTLEDARPLPEGFKNGELVTTQVTGRFSIRGVQVPIIFDVEARDDGDILFIIGRTSFVWSDFGMTAPNIGTLIQVTDEVSVEVLLAVRPDSAE